MSLTTPKRSQLHALIFAGASALMAWLTPGIGAAQESRMIEGVRPELHLGIGWHGDLGFGGRVDVPVVPSGFIDGFNDELALSPGGDLYFGGGKNDNLYGDALLAVQWNLYLKPEWSVFPEIGLAFIFGDGGGRDRLHLSPVFALGGRYHWSSRNSFVLRMVWPFGLQLGITF